MSLQGYVHQLRPRKESYANHVERLQTLVEQDLAPQAEIQKAIELAEFIDTKVASIDAQTTFKNDNKNRITLIQVVNDKDRIKFSSLANEIISSEEGFEPITITSARSEKDYHFKHSDISRSIYVLLKPSGAKGQVREDPNELLTGIFSCLNYKNPTNIQELDVLIDRAKENISKSQGHTQSQIDLFDKAYTNACQALSAANSLRKMIGGPAEKVFMTGVKWPAEVAKFKRESYGMKDFNSSDIILKRGNTYFGVSLKKKESKKAADPTILNKAFDTILNGPNLSSVKEKLNNKKEQFYIALIKKAMSEGKLNKKSVNSKNWKTFLGGGKTGTKLKLGNDYVNQNLKSGTSIFKDMADIIKANEKIIAESLINLVLKLDLQDLRNNNFMFSLITGNGRYGPKIGAVIEEADVYDIDTIVEKMDRLGWSERDLSIEFNKNKSQAFHEGATAAKLFYVIKVGQMDIIQIELRYKGSFTAQPQFFATFTNKFKAILK